MSELSARTVAGIVIELETSSARLVRIHAAIRKYGDDYAIAQRLMVRTAEINRRRRELIRALDEFTVDMQIAEAFNPGMPFVTEADDLVRGCV